MKKAEAYRTELEKLQSQNMGLQEHVSHSENHQTKAMVCARIDCVKLITRVWLFAVKW